MKETVGFDRAPPVIEWLSVLTTRGWQVTYHDDEEMRARREIGSAEHPVRLATTWHALVVENGRDGVDITVEVPAFADSRYATHRLRGTIVEWAEVVDGDCETETEFEVDILGALRENKE